MNVLPLLTVNVPELVKLPVVVKLALFPKVRILVLDARFNSAFEPFEVFSMVPPSIVNVAELVVMFAVPVLRSRLPPSSYVPADSVVPLIWVRAFAVKLSPLLMVSVPVLLKLAAVVDALLLEPPMVSLPLFTASPASALLLFAFSMVPPARTRVAALVVMFCVAPVRFRFESGDVGSGRQRVAADLAQRTDFETGSSENRQRSGIAERARIGEVDVGGQRAGGGDRGQVGQRVRAAVAGVENLPAAFFNHARRQRRNAGGIARGKSNVAAIRDVSAARQRGGGAVIGS